MKTNLELAEVPIRELRLGSFQSYQGTAVGLCAQCMKTGKPGCEQTASFSQCGECSAQRAIIQVASILDTAMINHGPVGCAGDFTMWNRAFRIGLEQRNLPSANIHAISSNLTEHDTVMGGSKKLKDAIQKAYERFHPKAIFILTSCVSGIIGEDVEKDSRDMEHKFGIPIVAIFCEGFKSKIWTSGFDAAFHGILKKIVKPPEQRQTDLINIVNFSGSHTFTPLLKKIGLRTTYIVPYSTVSQLEHISEAAATTHICETLGTYISHALEELYNVPEVKSPVPYGIDWTDAWLREIGRITQREEPVENLIRDEHEKIAPRLAELREKLTGKRGYVFAGDSYAHSIISGIRSLGVNVVGVTSYHHDARYDSDDSRLNSLKNVIDYGGDIKRYTVFTKQPYQAIHILKELKPDFIVFRHPQMAILGVKLGIPTVTINGDANWCALYDGVLHLGEKILDALQMRNFLDNISHHAKFPYSQWWYQQDPFYFVEDQSVE